MVMLYWLAGWALRGSQTILLEAADREAARYFSRLHRESGTVLNKLQEATHKRVPSLLGHSGGYITVLHLYWLVDDAMRWILTQGLLSSLGGGISVPLPRDSTWGILSFLYKLGAFRV